MKWLLAAVLLFGSVHGLAAQSSTSSDAPPFLPPETLSVTDPGNSVTLANIDNGTVVLDVWIDAEGKVKNVQVRRDIGGLTDVAVQSVKEWKFAPAKLSGKPVDSRITVAFNFRPAYYLASAMPLPPLSRQTDESRIQQAYQPPEVTNSTFPDYPARGVAPGTVVLEVTVSDKGKPGNTKVLHDVPAFTPMAVAAAENWAFMPATWNGQPLPCTVVLAFVFRLPVEYIPSEHVDP